MKRFMKKPGRMLPLLPAAALLLPAGCGRMEGGGAGPVEVTTATFAREVEQAEGVVVVDFWASWCGPCRAIAPSLRELAREYEGRVKICKVDVDANRALAERFKIESIPCLIMFKGGRAIDLRLGARRKAEYAAWFDQHLGAAP